MTADLYKNNEEVFKDIGTALSHYKHIFNDESAPQRAVLNNIVAKFNEGKARIEEVAQSQRSSMLVKNGNGPISQPAFASQPKTVQDAIKVMHARPCTNGTASNSKVRQYYIDEATALSLRPKARKSVEENIKDKLVEIIDEKTLETVSHGFIRFFECRWLDGSMSWEWMSNVAQYWPTKIIEFDKMKSVVKYGVPLLKPDRVNVQLSDGRYGAVSQPYAANGGVGLLRQSEFDLDAVQVSDATLRALRKKSIAQRATWEAEDRVKEEQEKKDKMKGGGKDVNVDVEMVDKTGAADSNGSSERFL